MLLPGQPQHASLQCHSVAVADPRIVKRRLGSLQGNRQPTTATPTRLIAVNALLPPGGRALLRTSPVPASDRHVSDVRYRKLQSPGSF